MKKIIAVALLLLFLLGGVSEAVNLKKSIIGKWFALTKTDEQLNIEFLKDGTVIMIIENNSQVGSYKFIDDNRLKMEFLRMIATVWEISIEKQEQLIMTSPTGEVRKLYTKAEWEKRPERNNKSALTDLKKFMTFTHIGAIDSFQINSNLDLQNITNNIQLSKISQFIEDDDDVFHIATNILLSIRSSSDGKSWVISSKSKNGNKVFAMDSNGGPIYVSENMNVQLPIPTNDMDDFAENKDWTKRSTIP